MLCFRETLQAGVLAAVEPMWGLFQEGWDAAWFFLTSTLHFSSDEVSDLY